MQNILEIKKKPDFWVDKEWVDEYGKRKGKRYNTPWEKEFDKSWFDESWITNGADKKLVQFAKNAGEFMAPLVKGQNDSEALTNSQIRNVFGEIKRIQMKKGSVKEKFSSFYLLRAKVAYAAGRNDTSGMKLFEKIFDKAWHLVEEDDDRFLNFCNLFEAIIAFHKSFGGK